MHISLLTALIFISSMASAQGKIAGYEVISQGQINQQQSATTDISYSTISVPGEEVILTAGGCKASTDRMTNIIRAELSIAKCEAKYTAQLVTINPKGLFNEKSYVVAGSVQKIGVSKSVVNQTVSQDISKIVRETDNLEDFLAESNAEAQCRLIEKTMTANQSYSREDKALIAECFGL